MEKFVIVFGETLGICRYLQRSGNWVMHFPEILIAASRTVNGSAGGIRVRSAGVLCTALLTWRLVHSGGSPAPKAGAVRLQGRDADDDE